VSADLVEASGRVLDAVVAQMGGSTREGQASMVAEGTAALEDRQHLLVQAGTGTGKSVGYLVPLLTHCATNGVRGVVSTATLALQRQILVKDAPVVVDAVASVAGGGAGGGGGRGGGAGTHAGAFGQGVDGQAVTCHKGVAGVFTLEGCGDHQAGAGRGGQVLEGVYCHVHAVFFGGVLAVEQALAQCRGEYAGAAEGCQRAGEHVTFGFDGAQGEVHDLSGICGAVVCLVFGVEGGDGFGGDTALGQGEGRPAGAQDVLVMAHISPCR